MKNIENFEDFNALCQLIADRLHTTAKAEKYSEYGFGCVAFETDPFGGTYCNFHYDIATGKVVDWYGSRNAKAINTCEELLETIIVELDRMLKVRDFDELYDFINSQY